LDLLPIFFLLLFVLLGGIIAVVADNVGRKLGKKRLQFWGLRPKHTAMLGTFLMGVLISIFTIFLVTVFSSDVRTWIIEGRRAVAQRNTALAELKGVRDELGQQGVRIEQLDKEIRGKVREVTEQRKTLTALNDKITKLQTAAKLANQTIDKLDRERANTQRELTSRQNQLSQLQHRLVEVQTSLKLAQQQTKEQQALAQIAGQQKEETDRANLRLNVENAELEKNIGNLQADIKRLSNDQRELEEARDVAKKDLEAAQRELSTYQARLSTTQQELQLLQQQAMLAQNFYEQITGQARTAPIIYQLGDEVARLPLEGASSVTQAEDSVTTLLRAARVNAGARGAKARDDFPEAGIIDHRDPLTQDLISATQIQRQIVQQIAGTRGPLVLIATASVNTFRGEPVSLELQVVPNPVVYTKGQMIAESVIDGLKDEVVIFNQLEELLSNKVRQRAQKDKMIPKLGTDQFGEVTPADILNVMSRVKAAGRTIRVQAIAASDTRAADPLKLEFRLR
jgi:uncharacterized protein (DUF3084 family)